MSPQQITNGFIQGRFPEYKVVSGDRFQATIGCKQGATSCYVTYRLDYEVGSTIRTFWTFRERYEGWTYNVNLDLSPLAGQTVRFILYINAYGSPVGDQALWANPLIISKNVPPPVTVTPGGPTVTAVPTTPTIPPSTCDKAQFVSDVTVPDGTEFPPNTAFTKVWRIRNVGTCTWDGSYRFVYISGDKGALPTFPFPKSPPQVNQSMFRSTLSLRTKRGSTKVIGCSRVVARYLEVVQMAINRFGC